MDDSWARLQTAVYWERLGPDGYGGWEYEDPVEVNVFWKDTAQIFVDANGEQVASRSKVLVGQAMKLGDYLYLGSLDDLTSAADPVNTRGAYPIRQLESIPDFSLEYTRWAWL